MGARIKLVARSVTEGAAADPHAAADQRGIRRIDGAASLPQPAPLHPSTETGLPSRTLRQANPLRAIAIRGADARCRQAHRREHGGQPRGPDGHQFPRGSGQTARGQPLGDQRLPRSGHVAERSASPTSSALLWCERSATTCPQMNNTFVEGPDGEPTARTPRPRRTGSRHRPRETRRLSFARRAVHRGRRHIGRSPSSWGATTSSSGGRSPTSCLPTTSPASR